MAAEMVVARWGEARIPNWSGRRLGIEDGTWVRIESCDNRVVLSKVNSLFDPAGTSKLTRAGAIRRLDRMRAEERSYSTRATSRLSSRGP